MSTGGKAQLHGDSMDIRELQGREVMSPVELPAREPVGSELLTPIGKFFRKKRKRERGKSPISPNILGGEEFGEVFGEGSDIGTMGIPRIVLPGRDDCEVTEGSDDNEEEEID